MQRPRYSIYVLHKAISRHDGTISNFKAFGLNIDTIRGDNVIK